jgi:DNA-binding response OmpR family regulator
MKPSVFVVEDDHDIARLIRYHLESANHGVQTFYSADGVLREAERSAPSLFLLDIMMPGYSGLDLCRQIRQSKLLSNTPVIFVTARTSESERVNGLESGADDYVTKPFSPRELISRVRAVLRRYEGQSQHAVISAGELQIDTSAMTIFVRGKAAETTTTEFRLLEHFARHPGQVLTREQLLNAVWGENQFVGERSVDVYVRKLREKIELEPEYPRMLKTIRGAGYRFDVPKEMEPSADGASESPGFHD